MNQITSGLAGGTGQSWGRPFRRVGNPPVVSPRSGAPHPLCGYRPTPCLSRAEILYKNKYSRPIDTSFPTPKVETKLITPTLRSHRGFTLTELIVYVAVVGIAVVMFAKYMTGFVKTAKVSENKMLGSADLRLGLMKMENDLYEANEFLGVSRTSVTFICDMLRNPSYDRNGDSDGDGISNVKDTDADSDAQLKFSLPRETQWQAGYNLEDDDDDNNGARDVRIQIYYSSGAVYRGISVNEGPWQASELAADISSFTFVFYGSKREDLGKNIDLGDDGASGTLDAGEGDGVISEREIDWVQAPAGHGNRSGGINTPDELKYITSVAVYLESDPNHDGTAEAKLGTEIMPPLLPLKRRR